MDNKDLIFKKNDNSLEFVGNFEEYYKQELNPWRQLDSKCRWYIKGRAEH